MTSLNTREIKKHVSVVFLENSFLGVTVLFVVGPQRVVFLLPDLIKSMTHTHGEPIEVCGKNFMVIIQSFIDCGGCLSQ